MNEAISLAQAVEKFAAATHHLPDAALERAWAWGAYEEGVRFAFFRTYEELRQLAATTAAERAMRGPEGTAAHRALAQHQAAFRDLGAVLVGLGDDVLDRRPAEGEWPLRIILGHTIGTEGAFFGCIRFAVDQHRRGNPPSPTPEAEIEAVIGGFEAFERMVDNASLAEILAFHDTLHQRVLAELADIREDELGVGSLWWEGYDLPVRFRFHRFDSHLRQHTIQAEKTLAALGFRPNEAKRLLRHIYGALAEAEGTVIGAREVGADRWREVAAAIATRADEVAVAVREM